MSPATLLELAAKWEDDAKPEIVIDGSESAQLGNALAKGVKIGLNSAATDLRDLVRLLGKAA